jgi:elongation factor Tu
MMDDEELLELVEMELAELLEALRLRPRYTRLSKVLLWLQPKATAMTPDAPEYAPIRELMDVVDEWIPDPGT